MTLTVTYISVMKDLHQVMPWLSSDPHPFLVCSPGRHMFTCRGRKVLLLKKKKTNRVLSQNDVEQTKFGDIIFIAHFFKLRCISFPWLISRFKEHELLCSLQARLCQRCMWHLTSGSLTTTHFGHTPEGSLSSQWGAKSVFPWLFHHDRSFSRLEEKFPLRVSNLCNTNHRVFALRRPRLVGYSVLCPLWPSSRQFLPQWPLFPPYSPLAWV